MPSTNPSDVTRTTLITGISGFIAGNLANRLLGDGRTVVGTGRTVPVFTKVPFARVDLRDKTAVNALIETHRPHTVYHLAANSVLQAASDDGGMAAMLETNVWGTVNLLEACRRWETPVVIVASSDKQYGALAQPPYDDDDTTAFANGGVYELSKAQQDQSARLFAGLYDIPAIRVARLANIYGAGDIHWSRIVPGTIRRSVQGEPPRITAGKAGEALREYVFVDDAVDALVALANDAAQTGNEKYRRADGKLARVAFNIGSGDYHAAASVIRTVQRLLKEEHRIESAEPIVMPGTVGIFEPGSQFNKLDKLRNLLPTYAPLSLEDGLRRTIPWYLEHLLQNQG